MEVDPVVGERLLLGRHQGDDAEVAVPQPARGLGDVLGRRRVEAQDELVQRDAGEDAGHLVLVRVAVRAHDDAPDPPALVPDCDAAFLEPDPDTELLDVLPDLVPELARSAARVVELLDQGRDVLAPQAEDAEDRLPEREVPDPLGRPLRADLRAGDAPELLRVRAEERVVEPLAEADRDPVLEGVRGLAALALAQQVGERAAHRLPEAEPPEHVLRRERVRVVLAAVVDPRQPGARQEVLAEDRLPEALDRRHLREEAVAAEVEAEAVELDGLRDAADERVRLEHRRLLAALAEHVRGGEAGGPGPEDGDPGRVFGGVVPFGVGGRARNERRRRRQRLGEVRLRGVRLGVELDRNPVRRQRPVDRLDRAEDVDRELGRGPQRRSVEDRRAEVLHLERQGLDRVDLRRDDVARPVRELVLAERLRVGDARARVEDLDRLVARVVVDDHLLGADDRRPAQLARREPRELDVGDRPGREAQVDERDVGGSGDDAGARQGRDLGRRLAEPVAEDREVVRGQVPDDADVRLVQAEVDPAHGDEVDLAELARLDQLLHAHDRGAVDERVARHQDEPAPIRREREVSCGRRGVSERLLDEDVLSGRERGGCELVVARDGGRDRDRVDRRVLEHLVVRLDAADVGEALADGLEPLGPLVAQQLHVRAGRVAEVPDEVRPPVAEADDGDANRRRLGPVAVLRHQVVPVCRRRSIGVRSRSRASRPSDQLRT